MVKGLFGKTFNFFDVLLLSILVGYGYYFYTIRGVEGLFSIVGDAIFTAIVISYVASWIIRNARK